MPFWVGHACLEVLQRLQLLEEGLGPIARKNGGEELSHQRAFFKERRILCLVLLFRFKIVDRPPAFCDLFPSLPECLARAVLKLEKTGLPQASARRFSRYP